VGNALHRRDHDTVGRFRRNLDARVLIGEGPESNPIRPTPAPAGSVS
jgi:hypothetical protein